MALVWGAMAAGQLLPLGAPRPSSVVFAAGQVGWKLSSARGLIANKKEIQITAPVLGMIPGTTAEGARVAARKYLLRR